MPKTVTGEILEEGPFRQASRVWSNRLKRLQIWKFGVLMAVFWVISFVTTYIEAYSIENADDLAKEACGDSIYSLPGCVAGLVGGWGLRLDAAPSALLLIALVAYAYAYVLKGVLAYLPACASVFVVAVLFVIGIFLGPVDRLLIDVMVYIYPEYLRGEYVAVASWGAPIASGLVNLSALVVAVFQVWVVLRLGFGLRRHGEEFEKSKAYQKWSAPVDPVPGVREVFSEYFGGLRSRYRLPIRSERPLDEPSRRAPASDDAAAAVSSLGDLERRRTLVASRRRKKVQARRAGRAAKRARRKSR